MLQAVCSPRKHANIFEVGATIDIDPGGGEMPCELIALPAENLDESSCEGLQPHSFVGQIEASRGNDDRAARREHILWI